MSGFAPGWSIDQEFELLDAVEKVGPSSWEEVALLMGNTTGNKHRSASELEEHFSQVYVEGKCDEPELRKASFSSTNPSLTCFPSFCNSFPFLAPSDQPPRPPLQPSGSIANNATVRDYAGYNPARGDFSLPPDPKAELLLSNIQDMPSSLLESELQATMVAAYNRRLAQRSRSYRIVKEYGLVARSAKSRVKLHKERQGSCGADKWDRYSQLLCSTDLAWIVEGIEVEQELRARILRLQVLRGKGVTSLEMIPLLESMEGRRRDHWTILQSEEGRRKGARPLDIVGLPDFQRLNQQERNLSSELRILPTEFARLRGILVDESNKRGGVLLSEARPLLRIDVNKTRRMFDFLVKQGDIKTR